MFSPKVSVIKHKQIFIQSETIDDLRSKPVHKLLEKLGGWPWLDPKWKDRHTFTDLAETMFQETGLIYHLLGYIIWQDSTNATNLLFWVINTNIHVFQSFIV